jgi:hypothetical protein
MTGMNRTWAGWPTEAFRKLGKEEQEMFYKDAAGSGVKVARLKYAAAVSSFEEHSEWYQEGGEYLPLAVWAARGFNPELISLESKECDVKRNLPQLGDCYRVKIMSAGMSGKKGSRREEENSVSGPAPKRLKEKFKTAGAAAKAAAAAESANSAAAASAAPMPQPNEELDSDNSEDSDSDSSSSSSSRGKKKKDKKKKKGKSDKKTKKAAEKAKKRLLKDKKRAAAAKADGKAISKRVDAASKLALSLTPKTVPVKQSLDAMLSDPGDFTDVFLYSPENPCVILHPNSLGVVGRIFGRPCKL